MAPSYRGAHAPDAVNEGIAISGEKLAYLAEILIEMPDPDMFHHANRHHAVEPPLESTIVEFSEFDEVVNSGLFGPVACDSDLLGRDVDRNYTGTGRLRDVNCERAPARADLGHAHPGLQAELGGCADEFVSLGLFERLAFWIEEHCARIVETLVQEKSVEISREIVVRPSVHRCHADGIGLVPAFQTAPKLSHKLLGGMRAKAGAVDREQEQKVLHARPVLEGESAVHIGFAGMKLGIKKQLGMQSAVVQARPYGRTWALSPELMDAAVRVGEMQRAMLDEFCE
jgi:hypothetical protein